MDKENKPAYGMRSQEQIPQWVKRLIKVKEEYQTSTKRLTALSFLKSSFNT